MGADNQNGELSVMGLDPAGQLDGIYQRRGDDGWDEVYWRGSAIAATAPPAIARDSGGRNHIFAVAVADGSTALFELVQVSRNGGWGHWTKLANMPPSEACNCGEDLTGSGINGGSDHAFLFGATPGGEAWPRRYDDAIGHGCLML